MNLTDSGGTSQADLADGEAEDLLKIRRLADEEQVEGPAAAEVGHDDGVDGHRGEEPAPGGLEFLWQEEDDTAFNAPPAQMFAKTAARSAHLSRAHLVNLFADGGFDVGPLLLRDGGVFGGAAVRQQEPQDVPEYPEHAFT